MQYCVQEFLLGSSRAQNMHQPWDQRIDTADLRAATQHRSLWMWIRMIDQYMYLLDLKF